MGFSKEEQKQINAWKKTADYQQLKDVRDYEKKHAPKKPKRKAGKIAVTRASIQTRLRQARTDRYMPDGSHKVPVLDGIPLEEWKKIAKNGKTPKERDEAQARINAYLIQTKICAFWVWNEDPDVEPTPRALDLDDLNPYE